MKPQTCKRCHKIQYVIWQVDDELWEKICKQYNLNVNETLCIECFAELAGYIDLGNVTKNVKMQKLWDNNNNKGEN